MKWTQPTATSVIALISQVDILLTELSTLEEHFIDTTYLLFRTGSSKTYLDWEKKICMMILYQAKNFCWCLNLGSRKISLVNLLILR